MALEDHILAFEEETKTRFKNKPSIIKLSRLQSSIDRAGTETLIRSDWYKKLLKKESCPVYSFFCNTFGIVKFLLNENHSHFNYATNTISVPFKETPQDEEKPYFLRELSFALLYDRDELFGFTPNLLTMNDRTFIRNVFAIGFANFCTSQLLRGSSHEKDFDYSNIDPKQAQDYLTERVIRNKCLKQVLETAGEIATTPSSEIPAEKSKELTQFIGINPLKLLSITQKNIEDIAAMIPAVGYNYIESIIGVMRLQRADTNSMIDYLLKRVPETFNDLFNPSKTVSDK